MKKIQIRTGRKFGVRKILRLNETIASIVLFNNCIFSSFGQTSTCSWWTWSWQRCWCPCLAFPWTRWPRHRVGGTWEPPSASLWGSSSPPSVCFTLLSAQPNIATLGSILDSQQSWESGKFQLARWSHEVVIFPERTTHPHTHPPPPDHMDFLVWISYQIPSNGLCSVPPSSSKAS